MTGNIKNIQPNNQDFEKIIVKTGDEITDLVRKITSSTKERIILTFAEPSDVLISPINLKVIQGIADETDKLLVAQIIQNPVGVRNARQVFLTVTESIDGVSPDLWDKADINKKTRQKDRYDKLRKNPHAKVAEEVKSKPIEKIVKKPEIPGKKTYSDLQDEASKKFVQADYEKPTEEVIPTEFHKKIQAALEKSKTSISEKSHMVEQEGIQIALDGEMPDTIEDDNAQLSQKIMPSEPPKEVRSAYQGKDGYDVPPSGQTSPQAGKGSGFKDKLNSVALGFLNIFKKKDHRKKIIGRDFITGHKSIGLQSTEHVPNFQAGIRGNAPEIQARQTTPSGKPSQTPKTFGNLFKSPKFLASAGKIGLILLAVFLVVGFIYYKLAPLVNIQVFIQSKPVTVTKTFTGNPDVASFSLENSQVPVIEETVTKERSDNANTTGTGFKGTKAGGSVNISCGIITTPHTFVSLTAGTIFSTSGKNYVLVSPFVIECPGFSGTTLEASDVGPEYNIAMMNSTVFSIPGYTPDHLTAENTTAFLGGAKTEYKIVAQKDIDDTANKLKQAAFTEAETELKDKHKTDGWEIIPSTIKSQLDGDIKSDVPVNGQADIVNVSFKTKSTALYYKNSEFDGVKEQLLLDAANSQNLFQSSENLELKLDKNIISTVSIDKVENTNVTIKLVLTGKVKPQIDTTKIVDGVKGKSWDDGLKYLDGLNFTAKPTEVTFSPTNFPKGLRYFPTTQGRIMIKVTEVE